MRVNGLRLPREIEVAVQTGRWPSKIEITPTFLKACNFYFEEESLGWWFRPVPVDEMITTGRDFSSFEPMTFAKFKTYSTSHFVDRAELNGKFVSIAGLEGRRFVPGPIDWNMVLCIAKSGSYKAVFLHFSDRESCSLVISKGHVAIPMWEVISEVPSDVLHFLFQHE